MGSEVEFLDVLCYVENNKIEHRLYIKEIDSRRFLQRDSFHPPHVFKSVPKSQMTRIMNLNSKDSTMLEDLEGLIKDLQKSGYKLEELVTIRDGLLSDREISTTNINSSNNHKEEEKQSTPVIFPLYYFSGLSNFR